MAHNNSRELDRSVALATRPAGRVAGLELDTGCYRGLDPLHRRDPDVVQLGGLADAEAGIKRGADCGGNLGIGCRATEAHSIGSGAINAGLDPRADQRALEFSEDTE